MSTELVPGSETTETDAEAASGRQAGSFFAFFNLFRKESGQHLQGLLFFAAIAGISNAGMLTIVNATASSVEFGKIKLHLLGIFVITAAVYILTKRFIMVRGGELMEDIVHKLRVRMVDKIRSSNLYLFDRIKASEIHSNLTQDAKFLSETAPFLVHSAQSAIMIVCSLLYVLIISVPAFLVVVGCLGFAVSVYLIRNKVISTHIRMGRDTETELLESLDDVLSGFKELKLSRRKNDALFYHISEISDRARNFRKRSNVMWIENYIFTQVIFYLAIGVIMFMLPLYIESHVEKIIQVVAAILFIVGPLENLINSLQVFNQANIAVDNMYDLEEKVDRGWEGVEFWEEEKKIKDFEVISMENVSFKYRDFQGEVSFSAGPFNLELKKGELLFVVGGNGSGKSTFLKLLTGLYDPEMGRIKVDGKVIYEENYAYYRELFAAIFTDFHLFSRMFGLEDVEIRKVYSLLKQMQLQKKTSFDGTRFSNLELSTGQRKRLALIVTMMEDKPIYVFDEVAADQDPEFRAYFYNTLLKDFLAEGKTIIVISHDDRYFHLADRVLIMKDGQFQS